nr:hypothetical protein [Tanacetum cinerariifolium]
MEQPQQITPADQLIHTSKYQTVGRCNNYAVLPNILCSKDFKQVPDANDTICFMFDKETITYTVDMFCSTLKLQVETLKLPFIPPATLEDIQQFLKITGYQGLLDMVSAFYTKNLTQPWKTMFKVFNRCLTSRTHSMIKQRSTFFRSFTLWLTKFMLNMQVFCSGISFIVSSRRRKLFSILTSQSLSLLISWRMKGMLIPNNLITDEIRDTQEYKDYVEEYGGVEVLMIQPQLVESTQGTDDQERNDIHEITQLSLRYTKEQENVVAVEKKLLEEDVEKLVEGDDEETYASEFATSVFLDEEDSNTRIEPGRSFLTSEVTFELDTRGVE